MSEKRKIIRAFVLTTVWILFFTITLSGVMTAGERTEKVMTGTVAFSDKSEFVEVPSTN